MELRKIQYYFDLRGFKHRKLFKGNKYIFGFLKILPAYIKKNLKPRILGTVMDGARVDSGVYLGRGSIVQPGAWIKGPAIIGDNCEIRHGAFIGANVICGDNVVIGHATEVHNSVFLNGAKAPHFTFVGHSVLGNNVNLGAGTKLSNLKITANEIEIEGIKTSLTKIGAVIGDNSSLGCNTVTQPATFIGKKVFGYPNLLLRGFLPSKSVVKLRQNQEITALNEN